MTRFPCPYLRGKVELTCLHGGMMAYAVASMLWLAEGDVEWKRS